MIGWICVIAGGPEDGMVVQQWAPRARNCPLPEVDCESAVCKPIHIFYDGAFSHAVFMHPDATNDELVQADAKIARLLGAARNQVYRFVTGVGND